MQVQYLVKLLSYALLLHSDTFSVYLRKKEQTKEREIKKTNNEEKKKKEKKKEKRKEKKKDENVFQSTQQLKITYYSMIRGHRLQFIKERTKNKKPRESPFHYIFQVTFALVPRWAVYSIWNATKVIGIALPHRKMLS